MYHCLLGPFVSIYLSEDMSSATSPSPLFHQCGSQRGSRSCSLHHHHECPSGSLEAFSIFDARPRTVVVVSLPGRCATALPMPRACVCSHPRHLQRRQLLRSSALTPAVLGSPCLAQLLSPLSPTQFAHLIDVASASCKLFSHAHSLTK